MQKKKITYSSVFKPYSDFLKPCSGVLLQKICKYQVWEPYGGIFNPYNDVFYALYRRFSAIMEIESLKLDFYVDFFPHRTNPLTNRDLKTRVLS